MSLYRIVFPLNTDALFKSDSDEPVPLNLPEQWLWDIVDEFIYQYQNFCLWRSKVKSKSDEELHMLAEGTQVRARGIPSDNNDTIMN